MEKKYGKCKKGSMSHLTGKKEKNSPQKAINVVGIKCH